MMRHACALAAAPAAVCIAVPAAQAAKSLEPAKSLEKDAMRSRSASTR
jgi:hypothetical protein